MNRYRRAAILTVLIPSIAACASSGPEYEYPYDVEWIPRYTREKPPKCPYEEVGSLDMRLGNDRQSVDRTGGERLERRRALEKQRDEEIRSIMGETGADAIFLYPRRPLVFIQFTDPECLE